MRLVKKSQVNTGQSEIGDLQLLNTTTKATLVDAINELQGGGGGGGSTVTTINGIVGDGSVDTPVKLGGSLTGFTNIFAGPATGLQVFSNNGEDNFFTHFNVSPGFCGIDAVDTGGTGISALIDTENSSGTIQARVIIGDNSNNFQGIIVRGTSPVSIIDDTNNIGLVGKSLFPVSNDPKQYAQYGKVTPVPSLFVMDVTSNFSVGTSVVLVSGGNPIPAPQSVITRVSITLKVLSNTGAGTIQFKLTYTDSDSNPHTVNLTPILTSTGWNENLIFPFIIQTDTLTDLIITAVTATNTVSVETCIVIMETLE